MKHPIESPPGISLGDFACKLDQLFVRKVLLQSGKQLVADFSRRARHGNGKIEYEFLSRTEHIAFFVVGEVLQFLFSDSGRPAVRRA